MLFNLFKKKPGSKDKKTLALESKIDKLMDEINSIKSYLEHPDSIISCLINVYEDIKFLHKQNHSIVTATSKDVQMMQKDIIEILQNTKPVTKDISKNIFGLSPKPAATSQ